MKLNLVEIKNEAKTDKRLNEAKKTLNDLLTVLEQKEISDKAAQLINEYVAEVNALPDADRKKRLKIRRNRVQILNVVQKEHKYIVKNHYRLNMMGIGAAAFGIPIGLLFGYFLGNFGYIGIGLPFGLVIGIGVGTILDKQATKTNRQIDIEM